ncbi:hypothetical protein HMPREF0971_01047 [Segatella oris F0302]|uniref:Uncharacterized protein n=1 Tax=Segatella oris F0302 TaxID=649760 RepID=D1QQ00_9BACT|nr:hypothetical protein HMPREF0971_01047 [Segatella oris F0302]
MPLSFLLFSLFLSIFLIVNTLTSGLKTRVFSNEKVPILNIVSI